MMSKKLYILRKVALCLMALFILPSTYAKKKDKIKVSVDYVKVMGQESKIKVEAKYKEGKTYVPATNVAMNVYEMVAEDSLVLVGDLTTDDQGKAEFVLAALRQGDTLLEYEFYVKVEDNAQFKDAKKKVKFFDCNLKTEVLETDTLDYLLAELTDGNGNPIKGQKIKVEVDRLFAPIELKETKTDRKGKIEVALEDPLPGPNGNLVFIVSLDARNYGTVVSKFEAPVGTVVVDKSTFDERTMWSPPNKTPIFLLIFPNLVILGIWIVIFILVRNLVLINKSK